MRLPRSLSFLLGLVLALQNAVLAGGAEGTCPEPMAKDTKCFTVHGRLYLTNGTPSVRIWPVGTHRILGVPGEGEDLPPCLQRYLDFETVVYADLEVCPLEPDLPGKMRTVCVKVAGKIVLERAEPGSDEPRVILPWVRECGQPGES